MKTITILGGGLAGLALGILLRRENVPVILYEAGKYPRHRVCGEFVSGRGRRFLEELGIGGRPAREASFFVHRRSPIRLKLPEPALCLSRFELDAALASKFQRMGGEIRFSRAELDGEGVVRATGRRRAEAKRGHLIGLKAHAFNASLGSDLEMHFGPNHYVGLCRLDEDRVNVCGLFFSRQALRDIHWTWPQLLREAVSSDALNNARWDQDSFCSVAALTLDQPGNLDGFRIGDAAAMIPPLTGNGMSMAFESAEVAAGALKRFADGNTSWGDACAEQNRAWNKRFRRRLRWAGFLQRLAFNSFTQGILFLMARRAPGAADLLFARTR